MKKAFVLFFFTGIAAALAAQGFSGGFRAGLNFSRFDGPTAQDGSGQSVESFNPLTGFSIGATAVYGFTDLVGLKADLMYSQKGAEYVYDGLSYFVFYNPNTGNETLTRQETDGLTIISSILISTCRCRPTSGWVSSKFRVV